MSDSLWRAILRTNFRSLDALASYLKWDEELLSRVLKNPKFPLNIPKRLAEKIEQNSLDDPILRQFIPLNDELTAHKGFVLEPVDDQRFARSGSLLQKYSGRALLVSTGTCAMHCRYCFRQNFDYSVKSSKFEQELETLRNDPSINEIILSGGDPLSLSTRELSELLAAFSDIPHIDIIRFHTRFPIGIPERITPQFLALLSKQPKQIIFVIHTNHAKELDKQVLDSLKSLQKLGIPILNQTVLLKGINDSFEVLFNLSQTLITNGIIPYYLHKLDLVKGAAHFAVPTKVGLSLIQQLRDSLPGYAVPSFVQEIPGQSSKTAIN